MLPYQYAETEPKLFWKRLHFLLRRQIQGRLAKIQILDPARILDTEDTFKYLGHGWEFSAYRNLQSGLIYKFPAGIFAKINRPYFGRQVKARYELLRRISPLHIIPTKFHFTDVVWYLTQPAIAPYPKYNYGNLSPAQREGLLRLSEFLKNLLNNYDWMPDTRPKDFLWWGHFSNICWNDPEQTFQIFDFSNAANLFRLDPRFTQIQVNYFNSVLERIEGRLVTKHFSK